MSAELTTPLKTEVPFAFLNHVLRPGLASYHPKTVFVDRDGVINLNRTEHVLGWQDFQFEENALEALQRLHQVGYKVIVVTNQAIIERGLVSAAEIQELHRRMIREIERYGGRIEAVLCCPHRPEANCLCRKPRPGMLLQAAKRYQIRLSQSWMIGDYLTDVQAGLAAGCKPVLVLTGRGQEAYQSWQQGAYVEGLNSPLTVKRNLLEAVEYILASEKVLV